MAVMVLLFLLPVSHAPRAEAASPKIEPEAKRLFYKMADAYRSLHSYSTEIDRVYQVKGKEAVHQAHCEIAFQKPNQASVLTYTRTSSGVSTLSTAAVASGTKTLLYLQKRHGDAYCETPSVAGNDVINTLISGAGSVLPISADFMMGTNLFPYLDYDGSQGLVSLTLQHPGRIDGLPVEVVQALYRQPNGVTSSTTFHVGKTDHLLRRIVESAARGHSILTTTVTFSKTRIDPDLASSRFVFIPPSTATRVADQKALYAGPPSRVRMGAKAPPLNITSLEAAPLSLEDYRGKVVLVDFWATWCAPCQEEIPSLVALYKTYHAQGLEILSIAEDGPKGADRVREFTRKHGMAWPQANEGGDSFGENSETFGVAGIPYTVLIGRDGTVRGINLRGTALKQAIKDSLSAGD